MIDFNDKIVTIVGRLATVSNECIGNAVARAGGSIRRGQPRHGGLLVVGRLAFRQLDRGGLRRRIEAADGVGARCISEVMFLEQLGLVEPGSDIAGVVELESLPGKTGLDVETLRLLILFDIIRPRNNQCAFRDLVAAREVARLLGEGISLGDVIEGDRGGQPDRGQPSPEERRPVRYRSAARQAAPGQRSIWPDRPPDRLDTGRSGRPAPTALARCRQPVDR